MPGHLDYDHDHDHDQPEHDLSSISGSLALSNSTTPTPTPTPTAASALAPYPDSLHALGALNIVVDSSQHATNMTATLQNTGIGIVHVRKPSDVGLHLQTAVAPAPAATATTTTTTAPNPASQQLPRPSHTQAGSGDSYSTRTSLDDDCGRPLTTSQSYSFLPRRSLENSTNISPASSISSSPRLNALSDVTPLPSPLMPSTSPEMWRMVTGRPKSNSQTSNSSSLLGRDEPPTNNFLPAPAHFSPPLRKKKLYNFVSLHHHHNHRSSQHNQQQSVPATGDDDGLDSHARNRSISETMPDPLHNAKHRHVTGPMQGIMPSLPSPATAPAAAADRQSPPALTETHMHREDYLSVQRGLVKKDSKGTKGPADPTSSLPSPPASNRSTVSDEGDDGVPGERSEYIRIHSDTGDRMTEWKILRPLGQGAFSQVVLASSTANSSGLDPLNNSRAKDLVAIKIMAHAPSGGTDEERVDTSIKREIEMLQSVSHVCLPRMRTYEDTPARALMVLDYCPGGDLFEFATRQKALLTPALVQRIFAELVDVVSYLHGEFVVHRDIKLENVLLNLPSTQLPAFPTTHPFPLITLTDLGLSKRIPRPPVSPLLNHPCGSEDYIAPEILLGQAYDGRATDAWALGVLLYALMESRLPFDLIPDPRKPHKRYKSEFELQRAKKHRIARCEWIWCEFGDEWGEWVPAKAKLSSSLDSFEAPHAQGSLESSSSFGAGHSADSVGSLGLEGARECVEGLLKKVGKGRLTLDQLAARDWVRAGICTPSRKLRLP